MNAQQRIETEGPPEPASLPGEAAQPATGGGSRGLLLYILSTHGLLIFGLVLAILFAILLPGTFAGLQTVRAILGNNTTVALLAMAEMLVIAGGNYDLSVAYSIGLMHIIAMSLIVWAGVPWPLVVIITILAGGLVGWINAALVEYAKIDSFIATLGVGTVLYGIGTYITNGTQVVGVVPEWFALINDGRVLGIPFPTYIVAAVAIVAWLSLEHLPLGRHLYAIGSNRRAAELTGVNSRRLVMGSFVCSGLLVGLAGVILAARLQVAQSSVGPEFLLPAFVGSLLGATTVRPGRVNAAGTIIAVLVLAVGIAGLQQLGNSFFVEPIFQGGALIVSVGLAGYAARRRKS
ncbi:MAG: ABC transporter permease [Devosia sp.]|jgi:ribose transport system permease protein